MLSKKQKSNNYDSTTRHQILLHYTYYICVYTNFRKTKSNNLIEVRMFIILLLFDDRIGYDLMDILLYYAQLYLDTVLVIEFDLLLELMLMLHYEHWIDFEFE